MTTASASKDLSVTKLLQKILKSLTASDCSIHWLANKFQRALQITSERSTSSPEDDLLHALKKVEGMSKENLDGFIKALKEVNIPKDTYDIISGWTGRYWKEHTKENIFKEEDSDSTYISECTFQTPVVCHDQSGQGDSPTGVSLGIR